MGFFDKLGDFLMDGAKDMTTSEAIDAFAKGAEIAVAVALAVKTFDDDKSNEAKMG